MADEKGIGRIGAHVMKYVDEVIELSDVGIVRAIDGKLGLCLFSVK